jgi:solute carrier family 45 protein 1/2/4
VNSLKEIWTTYQNLPLPIWHICKVQAFAWGGWFPILCVLLTFTSVSATEGQWCSFFSTTYVAEIYSSSHPVLGTPAGSPSTTLPHEADPGTRAGSRAMFLQSVFTFIMSIILPFFVNSSAYLSRSSNSPSKHDSSLPNPVASHSNHSRSKVRLSNDHAATSERSSTASLGRYTKPNTDHPFLDRILERLPTIPFPWLDLDLLWAISHVAFAVLMFSTWFVGAVWSATLILSLLSFSCKSCSSPFEFVES